MYLIDYCEQWNLKHLARTDAKLIKMVKFDK